MGKMLAVVTGASSGIGYQLAKELANRGYDLVIASAGQQLGSAAGDFRALGSQVVEVNVDLATPEGVERLWETIMAVGRPVDVACINAGARMGGGPFEETRLDEELNMGAIIKITRTAICGSDLHLYDGFIPTMEAGDLLGHEFMGIVEEVGRDVTNLRRGDRVVVPFTIACGNCIFCKKKLWSACDNTNPNAHLMEAAYGYSGSGLFGYSHMMGGYAGGQAQYARVPFANVGPLKIESDLPDEKVLFLSDIFPTGYMAAENAQIQQGDTVAVWGCGPVGQFAIASAFMLGAAWVIAIDRYPERLELARSLGAITIDYAEEDVSVLTALKDLTGGIGPDGCIDAVGLEAHSGQLQGLYDKVKTVLMMETDRPIVLRQAIQAVRKGGTLSIPGVYGGLLDKVPFGAAFGKGITMKMGQTNMHNYMKPLLQRIEDGQIDPSYIISHRITLDEAPEMYKVWRDKEEKVTKIVIDPWAQRRAA